MDDSDVINFLLSTEIIPLCLRIMETGSELSKTVMLLNAVLALKGALIDPWQVATFIVQKILQDEMGLQYICATADRFYAVSTVLRLPFPRTVRGSVVTHLLETHPIQRYQNTCVCVGCECIMHRPMHI